MPIVLVFQRKRSDLPLTSRTIEESHKIVMSADRTVGPITISDFAVLWEEFLKLPAPLELTGLAYGTITKKVFKTLIFSAGNDVEANKKFTSDLETEIYAMISLHKNTVDKYAKKYSFAVYQFSRGVQSIVAGGKESRRWYELVTESMILLEKMVD